MNAEIEKKNVPQTIFAEQSDILQYNKRTSLVIYEENKKENIQMQQVSKSEIASIEALIKGKTGTDRLEILIKLLFENVKKQSTLLYVLELLNSTDDADLEFYIVELVYIYIRSNFNEYLEKFLLFKCSSSIPLYLKIKWSYEAFTQQDRKEKRNFEKIDKVDQNIEEAMVNSTLVQSQQVKQMNVYIDKEYRSNYANSINIFISNLTKISLQLKTFPVEERPIQLRKYLIKANRALESLRRNNPDIIYCQGIILPFSKTRNSNMIVRILDSECRSFNTKRRVPYMVVFETIDIHELKDAVPRLKKQQSISSQAFLLEDQRNQHYNRQILEDFLQTSVKDQLARQQIIIHATKRFNLLYPYVKLSRRHSCCGRLQTIFGKNKRFTLDLMEFEKYHKFRRSKPIEGKDKLQFFNSLRYEYPQKQQTINQIVTKLNLEVENRNNQEENPISQLSEASWAQKVEAIQSESAYGHFESYRLRAVIIKGGDDLRQEYIVMQLIQKVKNIFESEGTGLWMQSYEIIITSSSSGILEFCNDTTSIDAMKKKMPDKKSLREIYQELFKTSFEEAQKNFIDSLAAYSLFQYLFLVKDRHNGNILVDLKGHIIHIDFGFILGISPGGINFESAPFKLTKEYVEMMDGKNSELFFYFRSMLFKGISALQKYAEEIQLILNIMKHESDLPCFEKFEMKFLLDRMALDKKDNDLMELVTKLVDESFENKRSALYDNFQKLTNGIMP